MRRTHFLQRIFGDGLVHSVETSAMTGKVLSSGGWDSRQSVSTKLRHGATTLTALFAVFAVFLFSFKDFAPFSSFSSTLPQGNLHTPVFDSHRETILAQCAALKITPGHSSFFHSRDKSDRHDPGTNATLIRNAVIFTGRDEGKEVVSGDILLDKGIIKGLGKVSWRLIENTPNLTVVDAKGAWLTPGLVDLHTHLGVLSAPILAGAVDLNSNKGPIVPWLRSIDGLNTHDDGYELAMAGGVTSAQVLPGNMNAIGGQAFIVKLRRPRDRSASSMIVEPPYNFNGPGSDYTTTRWRHLHHACGESVKKYGNRMDNVWALRVAYSEAVKLVEAQNAFCAKAENGLWNFIDTPFPQDIKWESLVDVIRGRVKVSAACDEAVDIDAMVRLSNEFRFPIASFHRASEAWLIPEIINKTYGGIPFVALSATNYRTKRESYRGSEFASRVLADEGIPVVMKSDHPTINSRHLLYEAQQAHHFGLPPHLALASVTSAPATAAGLAHRIGILTEGADADVVLWDSHPLRLGATPQKVWIDGILQIPVPSKKPGEDNNVEIGKGKEGEEWRKIPDVPNWDNERNESIKWDGLPPLEGKKVERKVVFTNVREIWRRSWNGDVDKVFFADADESNGQSKFGTVVVEGGKVTCAGASCPSATEADVSVLLDLRGGAVSPTLMTYGSQLGLEEIASEPSTADGPTYDAFQKNVPHILDDSGAVVRAMDALVFSTRNALLAYRAGVVIATSSMAKPFYLGGSEAHIISGLSATFRTGSAHAMQRGAIVQDVAALHVVMGKPNPALGEMSVSTQMAALRRLLYGWETQDKETGHWFRQAAEGVVPLVIEVDSADIMANLLILKADVEDKIGSQMRMVFSGAGEAHLLAKEISDAAVGVILTPTRPFPVVWDQKRILPGPPITNDTSLVTLLDNGVTVGLGVRNAWEAINMRFTVKWAALESNERISETRAYHTVTRDLEKLLGVRAIEEGMEDLVIFEGGGMWDMESKVIGVISPATGAVHLF